MYIALDRNFNRVHTKDSIVREKYFCPYCQSPLMVRKGDIRQHHYAHARGAVCSDTWSAERNSNDCEWHKEWQDRFPVDNQEISLALGEIKHRADVMIRRTVLEFQHSSLNSEKFSNRNAFYAGLGHKVIWIFDFEELYEEGRFEIERLQNIVSVDWKRPKHRPPVGHKIPISRMIVPSDITFQKAEVSDYTVGSVIKHQYLGIGTIIDITEIKEGVNIISIKFTDGRTDKLPLKSVVQSNLIMIGVKVRTDNE